MADKPFPHELLIEASRGESRYWKDLLLYRELFLFLAWRDFLVRYKQTAIGIAWAVIQPLLLMVILTIVFHVVAGMKSDSVPYPVLVLSGLWPWLFFAGALGESSGSLIANSPLVSKVYFPRLIVPASSVLVSLADFLVTGTLLAALMAWYGVYPGWTIVMLPVLLALTMGAAFGAGLWFSALNVEYRDFRYVVPFVIQLGLYASPVGFGTDKVPEAFRFLAYLNPMTGIIGGFRWSLLGGRAPFDGTGLAVSAALTAALLASGLWYFRRMEKTFADVI